MIVGYDTGVVVRITEREGPVFHVQVIAPEPAGHWWEWRGLRVRVGSPIEFLGFVRDADPEQSLANDMDPYNSGARVAWIRPRG